MLVTAAMFLGGLLPRLIEQELFEWEPWDVLTALVVLMNSLLIYTCW